MIFATPAWLLISALGTVVVLLHLRRRRKLVVSSIKLWERLRHSARRQSAWKPPRPSLLLVLQLLAVALLALALADPLLNMGGDIPEHRIFVIDGSGSMQATDIEPTRFEAARERLRDVLESWRDVGQGRMSIVSASSAPRVVAAHYGPNDGLDQTLRRLEWGDGPADLERVRDLVRGLIDPAERTQVVILSDGAGTDLATILREALPDHDIRREVFGTHVQNVVLTQANVEPLEVDSGRWRVFGEIRAYPPEVGNRDLQVLFRSDDDVQWQPRASHTIELVDGRGAFDFDVTMPGPGTLQLLLPDDALVRDNAAWFRVSDAIRTARVLYVGAGDNALVRALASVPHAEVTESPTLPAASVDFDLVVLDGVSVSRHPATHTLWVGSARLDADTPPGVLSDPTPTGWPDGNNLLADATWWTGIVVDEGFRVPRYPGAEVLLESAGAPLIQTRVTAWGHEVVLSFFPTNSNWTQHSSFPVFVANVVGLAVPDIGTALVGDCHLGRLCSIDPKWLRDGAVVRGPGGMETDLPSPFVPAELEGRPAWAPSGFHAPFRPLRTGMHELDTGTGVEHIAVNGLRHSEGDLVAGNPSPETTSLHIAGPLARQVLLGIALLVLLVEALVAGRGSEGFLRAAGLAGNDPLAGRRRALLALRIAAVAATALAIVNVPLPAPERRSRVVIVADGALADPASRQALEQLYASTGQASTARLDSSSVDLGMHTRIGSTLDSTANESAGGELERPGTDLEGGLDLAAGLLPNGGGGRIVLASDGSETRGNVASILPDLSARGIPVDVLPLWRLPPGDMFVETVTVAPRLVMGDSFNLNAVVTTVRGGSTDLTLLRDGVPLTQLSVELRPGRNLVETTVSEEEPGSYLYEFAVEDGPEGLPANNRGGVVAEVGETPTLLLVTENESAGASLAAALQVQGLTAEIRAPNRLPWELEEWLRFDVVALMNVPAIDLHSRQQHLIEQWVQDHGGGLLLLGGENTFGPGGYYQTALERVSPLSSKIPREAPEVALLFVLDRSGSMQQIEGDGTRLHIAKEAALSAIDLLPDTSIAGVVVFDAEATTIVPPQSLANRDVVRQALEPLVPGGGTSIYPALVEAYEQMQAVDAMTRHIVLMSDGLSQPGEFDEILDRITSDEITVSTVSIGSGADSVRLELMARAAGGAFHETRDFAALPSILSQEALLLSSTPIEERTVQPTTTAEDAAVLAGLPNPLPAVAGYVLTTPKPEAEVLLSVDSVDGDLVPLLASWRYGAGRVTALTTHAAGAWAEEWTAMPEYPLLWSQIVRSVLRESSGPGIELDLVRRGDEVLVTLRASDATGDAVRGLDPVATYTTPETAVEQTISLDDAGPGIYQGSFAAFETGTYVVRIDAHNDSASAMLHVPYPASLASSEPDLDRLMAIATATGGKVLGPGQAPIDTPTWRWVVIPGWRIWVLLVLAIFLIDLLIRYAPEVLAPVRLVQRFRRMRQASTN